MRGISPPWCLRCSRFNVILCATVDICFLSHDNHMRALIHTRGHATPIPTALSAFSFLVVTILLCRVLFLVTLSMPSFCRALSTTHAHSLHHLLWGHGTVIHLWRVVLVFVVLTNPYRVLLHGVGWDGGLVWASVRSWRVWGLVPSGLRPNRIGKG